MAVHRDPGKKPQDHMKMCVGWTMLNPKKLQIPDANVDPALTKGFSV